MATGYIDITITEYRIWFDQEDHCLAWCKSCTTEIKFTYCKTRKYGAGLANVKDKEEI